MSGPSGKRVIKMTDRAKAALADQVTATHRKRKHRGSVTDSEDSAVNPKRARDVKQLQPICSDDDGHQRVTDNTVAIVIDDKSEGESEEKPEGELGVLLVHI